MKSLGVPELIIILGIAVLLFGGRKIPEVAKGLGEGIRNFKTALKGDESKKDEARNTEVQKQA
jgi:sec-independent protein translocase protein TatA